VGGGDSGGRIVVGCGCRIECKHLGSVFLVSCFCVVVIVVVVVVVVVVVCFAP
jgi:hypothetical protein